MKAVVFHKVGEPLSVETLPDPTPEGEQVVLKVAGCGICGTDLHLAEDHALGMPSGTVFGHEMSGEVVAIGRGVENLRIGDRVAAIPLDSMCGRCDACIAGDPIWCRQAQMIQGGYAQYMLANSQVCVKLPDSVSLADGALVEPLAVALHAVRTAGMVRGARVLVLGCGPIGLGIILWARLLGAGHVDVIEGVEKRILMARQLGADSVSPIKAISASPQDVLKFGGVNDYDGAPDIVFECVGLPGLLGQAIEYVKPRGIVTSVGFCMRGDPIMPARAAGKEVTIRFPMGYSKSEFEMAADLLDGGGVDPRILITETVSLNNAPYAFDALRHDKDQCKVRIAPWL